MSGNHPTGERLNAYLLEELDAAASEDVAAHLQACLTCRDAVARLEATLIAYREAEPEAAAEVALRRLLAARRIAPTPRPRWASVVLAAAVTAVIFMGGFWAGHRDAMRSATVPTQIAPAAAPENVRHQPDREPPAVYFAVADADLLGGLAPRDTTWN